MARQPVSSLPSPIKSNYRENVARNSIGGKIDNIGSKRDESTVHTFLSLQRTSSLFGETSTTSSSTRSSDPEDLSAHRIRAKYFYRLGIGKPQVPPSSHGNNSTMMVHTRKPCRSNSLPSHVEVLKDDLGQPDVSLTLLTSLPQHTHSKFNKKAKVAFNTEVNVHFIPHRSQYSSCDKERLWMVPHELEKMAYRNCIEFTVEQWDWRQAIEESDFVLVQGILTHPAHAMMQQQQLQQRCTPSRQFCMIFSAQQQQQHSRRHHKLDSHRYSASPLTNSRFR